MTPHLDPDAVPGTSGEYAICACSNVQCRLRYGASRRDAAYTRCPACHGPVVYVHIVRARAEHAPAPDAAAAQADVPLALPLAALLDNLRSVFNVGSIFRSADGAGFGTLYLCGITPTPHNPKLAKTALGAHTTRAWRWAPNAVELAQELLACGHQLWALEEGAGAESLYSAPPPPPHTVLVVGSEVLGIDPDLLALCTRTLSIPMRGSKRSLNAATAFGVAALILSERMQGTPAAGQQPGDEPPLHTGRETADG